MKKVEEKASLPPQSYNTIVDKINARENRKTFYSIIAFGVVLVAAVTTSAILLKNTQDIRQRADTTTPSFVENFDGTPSSPLPLGGTAGKNIFPNWDIQVHSRDDGTWDNLETQTNVMHPEVQ